ncbi:hypothetical protein O1611_g5179 [Lasiodiplodia mahajangana]|uniref:Uncharacterized protein n=1 Tax=Lasiodiplodia mahajangana TaxID=1108764 RepID=A0ACC2JM16_9PEZI|nr:hypothetical protein O1611_g5179 [Lasiodiplodia mahajangana]
MRVAMTAVLLSVAAAQGTSKDVGQFFNPPNAVTGSHNYSANHVYHLGQKQTIKFTTVYQNYKIDLWQQRPNENAGSLGPAVFQTTGGAVTQFDWIVQAYQFDLSYSDMFFFWLTSNDKSESQSVTSHYFNITQVDAPASSPTISPSPSTTPNATNIPSTSSPTSSSQSGHQTSSGLSAGAQAGIGVGAALVGLAAIIVAFVIYRHSRVKGNHKLLETNPSQTHEAAPRKDDREYYKPQVVPIAARSQQVRNYVQDPVELPA